MKTYMYKGPWDSEETEIWFEKDEYENGRLAIEAWCDDGPYTTLTVNLPQYKGLSENDAFVDTNDNPGLDIWLHENGIAEFVGIYGASGFCYYPLMRFNIDKI